MLQGAASFQQVATPMNGCAISSSLMPLSPMKKSSPPTPELRTVISVAAQRAKEEAERALADRTGEVEVADAQARLAEAAAQLAPPNSVLQELRDFSIPYGIKILKQRPKEILVEAARQGKTAKTIDCRITSQFGNPKGIAMGQPTLHYQGTYQFGPAPLPAEQVN